MKELKINGIYFELSEPRRTVSPCHCSMGSASDIYRCYERPSSVKVSIWHSWLRWAQETDGITDFAITSHNCMQFSISGLYTADDGSRYNLWITRDHIRAIRVTE